MGKLQKTCIKLKCQRVLENLRLSNKIIPLQKVKRKFVDFLKYFIIIF